MRRSVAIFILCLAAIVAGAPRAAPARADAPAMLTAGMKDRLAALGPLRGAAIDRALLDGRPVLVKFFASW